MRCKMARDPKEEEKLDNERDDVIESPEKEEEKDFLKDYLAKAGITIPPGMTALDFSEKKYREQALHDFPGNHPSLQRGTLEDVPELTNTLREIVTHGTDAIEALRKTGDYGAAMAALEKSGPFIRKDEGLFAKDPLSKGFAYEFPSINDNRANVRALDLEYLPSTGDDVRLGVRTLRIFTGAGEGRVRDVLLQRRMAYELAVSDYEARLANRFAEVRDRFLTKGEPTEAEPEGIYKILDLGNQDVVDNS
ncbi:hypothetical protein KY335_06025 [Candidatus Woesearchaeota archaeon]|nr:hypothetical protein [Candidatus Woesearchaeota archaeon]